MSRLSYSLMYCIGITEIACFTCRMVKEGRITKPYFTVLYSMTIVKDSMAVQKWKSLAEKKREARKTVDRSFRRNKQEVLRYTKDSMFISMAEPG